VLPMRFPRVTIKAVAIVALVLHLFLPAVVHARSLALFEADKLHNSVLVCLEDDDNSHDSTDSQEHDTRCCHLDSPFDITHLRLLDVAPAVNNRLASPITGRLLPGYSKLIYFPPRQSA
jgi:hypothetical protein